MLIAELSDARARLPCEKPGLLVKLGTRTPVLPDADRSMSVDVSRCRSISMTPVDEPREVQQSSCSIVTVGYSVVIPPSTRKIDPVAKVDSSLAR